MNSSHTLRRSETKTGFKIGLGKAELDYGRGFPQVIRLPNGVALIDKKGFRNPSYIVITKTETDARICHLKPNDKSTCEIVALNPDKPSTLVR